MADLIECTPKALASYVPCINCASDHQLMAAIAVLLCKIVKSDELSPDCSPAVMLEENKCYQCYSEQQFLEGIVKLLVNWILVNVRSESELNILHDISCTTCLSPAQIRAIIIGQLCTGIHEGKILCSLPE